MKDYLTEFEKNETPQNEWIYIIPSCIVFGLMSYCFLIKVFDFLYTQ